MKLLALLFVFGVQSALSSGYIVKLKEDRALSQNQALSLFQTSDLSLNQLSVGTFYLVNLKEVGAAELRRIKNDSRVEYIAKNETINLEPIIESSSPSKTRAGEGDSRVSDPGFAKQWALKNDGINGKKAGVDLSALETWDFSRGNKKIKIAVIDTGVDYNHEDLKDNIFINEAEANGQKGVDDDGNGYIDDIYGYDFANNDANPMDDNGHGTHCAGIIAAMHNDLGVRGIMKNASILPVKAFGSNGSATTMSIINAIDYAIKMGVDIMSNSWGSKVRSGSKKKKGPPQFNQAQVDVIKRAEEKGIIFVAAAGNASTNSDKFAYSPAGIPLSNIISVGSIESSGKKSEFSNYGVTSVDVMAPGTEIYSTIVGGKYKSISGTSMATPYVSGIAGLILSLEPTLTPAEVRKRLISTSILDNKLSRHSVSKGRVDALRAIQNTKN